jgi:hypothetical protein
LTSTTGIPVEPAVSGKFVRGNWTGSVMVMEPTTNLVLQADDGLGDTGLANAISVLSPPVLEAEQYGRVLVLFWPADVPGFEIETAPRLNSTNWVPMATAPLLFEDQYLVAFPITASNGFYRLWYTLP